MQLLSKSIIYIIEMSGSIDAPAEAQVANFGYALREYGDSSQAIPANWTEAFEALKQLLKNKLNIFGMVGHPSKAKSCSSSAAVPRLG